MAEFGLANKGKCDLSGAASKGAVWKAGAKGQKRLMCQSLKSKSILFLLNMHYGLYPTYKPDTKYLTYEGMLNGRHYAITFQLVMDDSPTASGWVPFSVQKMSEFSAVKSNTGGKAQQPASNVSTAPLDAPNAFYANVGTAPAETGSTRHRPKPIQGTGSPLAGGQQPPTKMVGPMSIIASEI